ncbi:MAG: CocE/NonD family hydrolase [Pseudomonadota bacterium]|nr:CocE/NonD family hydrolase [Pseudomonadota bacterium]
MIQPVLTRRMHKLVLCLLPVAFAACNGASDEVPPTAAPPTLASDWFEYNPAPAYSGTTRLPAEYITMSDGTQLSAQVMLPTDANGQAVEGPLPVILTQTGYNKSASGYVEGFAFNRFLVEHGYAHVAVDVRGTGASQGTWEIFSEREQLDYREVMDWIVEQPWSNDRVGTWGPSFMAITQIYTAAWQHPAHQAMFAIVPMADAYRDIVFTGGQVNVGFIPLWIGLVTGLGLIPAHPSPEALSTLLDHLQGTVSYDLPVILQATLGVGGQNYDGPFWRTRSPIEVADQVRIPTVIVGGLRDIFQRGEPMLYEAIKPHATTKLVIGPWTHLDASSGAGLPADGVPDLNHMALLWFDRYLKNLDNRAESVPAVTQYVWNEDRYVRSADWPHPQARAERWFLRGDGALTPELPATDEPSRHTVQIPVQNLCSASSAQWTAGVLELIPLPCFQGQNTLNELPLLGAVTYTTEPMDTDYYVNGPMQADLWLASELGSDGSVAVRVTSVSPTGESFELTNGLQTFSTRQTDLQRSRLLDGESIQPWHPYTAESVEAVAPGESTHVAVEIFPSSFVIPAGHRLRVAIASSDFPHGLPPVTDLLDQVLGIMRIDSQAARPSSIVLPVVPVDALGREVGAAG